MIKTFFLFGCSAAVLLSNPFAYASTIECSNFIGLLEICVTNKQREELLPRDSFYRLAKQRDSDDLKETVEDFYDFHEMLDSKILAQWDETVRSVHHQHTMIRSLESLNEFMVSSSLSRLGSPAGRIDLTTVPPTMSFDERKAIAFIESMNTLSTEIQQINTNAALELKPFGVVIENKLDELREQIGPKLANAINDSLSDASVAFGSIFSELPLAVTSSNDKILGLRNSIRNLQEVLPEEAYREFFNAMIPAKEAAKSAIRRMFSTIRERTSTEEREKLLKLAESTELYRDFQNTRSAIDRYEPIRVIYQRMAVDIAKTMIEFSEALRKHQEYVLGKEKRIFVYQAGTVLTHKRAFVDRWGNLFVETQFLESLDSAALTGLMTHEAFHLFEFSLIEPYWVGLTISMALDVERHIPPEVRQDIESTGTVISLHTQEGVGAVRQILASELDRASLYGINESTIDLQVFRYWKDRPLVREKYLELINSYQGSTHVRTHLASAYNRLVISNISDASLDFLSVLGNLGFGDIMNSEEAFVNLFDILLPESKYDLDDAGDYLGVFSQQTMLMKLLFYRKSRAVVVVR